MISKVRIAVGWVAVFIGTPFVIVAACVVIPICVATLVLIGICWSFEWTIKWVGRCIAEAFDAAFSQ